MSRSNIIIGIVLAIVVIGLAVYTFCYWACSIYLYNGVVEDK